MNMFKTELLKLKRSHFLEIIMAIPMVFVIIGISNFIRYKSLFLKENPSIWEPVYEQSALMYGVLLLPILVTLVMGILVNIENTDNNLRKMLALPINKSQLYIYKFLVGAFLIFINIGVFIIIVTICGNILKPTGSSMPLYVIYRPLLAYFSLIPVMAIQYYLSMKFSNVFVAIGVGTFISIPSVIIGNSKFWIISPWCYGFKAISATHTYMPLKHYFFMYGVGLIVAILFTLKGVKEFEGKEVL